MLQLLRSAQDTLLFYQLGLLILLLLFGLFFCLALFEFLEMVAICLLVRQHPFHNILYSLGDCRLFWSGIHLLPTEKFGAVAFRILCSKPEIFKPAFEFRQVVSLKVIPFDSRSTSIANFQQIYLTADIVPDVDNSFANPPPPDAPIK